MDEEPRTTLRRSSRVPLVLLGLAAVALVAIAVVRLRTPERFSPALPPPSAVTPDAAPGLAGDPGPDVDPRQVAPLLESVSPNPLYRRGLAAGEDPLSRAAVLIDNVAEGVSPRRQLAFLAPEKPFTAVKKGERTVVDPASYARYDGFGDAVASVDAPALARVYRAIHRPLEAAYRTLGYPGASLDAVLARALRRLEAAPVVDGDVDLVDEGGVYVFQEPRLERLRAVDKHLLRMGPRNTRLLQQKAKELRDALGLPAAAATPDAAR